MYDQPTRSVPGLLAGIVASLLVSGSASAQPRSLPGPGQPARPNQARNPNPVSQDLSQPELKARRDFARAQQIVRSGGHDADAIQAARDALKGHIRPAPGVSDELAIEALSLLAALHNRNDHLAEEVGVRRELLDAVTRSFAKDDWRIKEVANRLADAEHRLASTPEHRRRLAEASELLGRALTLLNAGRPDEALQPAERATSSFSDLEGDEHRDVSSALIVRGMIHRARREYGLANALHRQALGMRRKVLGENHPDTILVLHHLASLTEAQGDLALAVRLFDREMELGQQAGGNESADRTELLETIGRLLVQQGDHAEARRYLERASDIRERSLFAARATNSLRGRPFVAGGGPRLGGGIAHDILGIGGVYSGLGRPSGGMAPGVARLLFGDQRTTRDRPPVLGSQFPSELQDIMEGQGVGGRGVFGGHRHDDNLAMAHNPSHPWTLRLRAMQMYVRAAGGLALVQAIASAFEEGSIRGDAWVAYARSVGRLADLAEAQGDIQQAQLLRLRSAAVGLEATDPAEPSRGDYAEFLDVFIRLIREMGESRLAQDLALQSVVDRKLAWGDRHTAYAAGLDRLAEIVWARGDRIQAMLLYEKARDIRRMALGKDHFDLAASSYRLALLHQEGGNGIEAQREAGESLALSESFVMAGLPFLPERQRLAFLAQTSRALWLFMDVARNEPGDVRETYRHVLAWKGVATEAAAAQHAAAATPELRRLSEELNQARDQINQLFYAAVPPEHAATHARRVRAQTKLRDELEARLAEGVRWNPTPPIPAQIAEALPRSTVLVDIARYQHFVSAPGPEDLARTATPATTHFRLASGTGPAMQFEARYVAFVIRSGDQQPARIELGPAATIDEAVMTWLDRIEHGGDLESPARQLARDLWAPLVPHISPAQTVLVSPDGTLAFLPWGALPGALPGTYLLEDHGFCLVGSARFLVRDHGKSKPPQSSDLLVVGGVDYALAQEARASGPDRIVAATRSAPVAGKGLKLSELPGTRSEADAIIKLFAAGIAGNGNSELISGPQATKARVRRSLLSKSFLHLATHGYFASPEFASALGPENTGAPSHSLEGMDQSEVRGLYPGLLSGLVFAGANQPARDPVTGVVDFGSVVMTAEEIAGLDLSACDLAVLSACETGRGSVAGGEGVLGLQRAFHQAGAHTVVASLWKVNDAATSALMEQFYTNLWSKKMPKLEALRQAQLTVLNDPGLVKTRRAELAKHRGIDEKPEKLPEGGRVAPPGDRASRSGPSLWAAFVLSGDGR
jgi:CHAT domain-containing protein/tetratricopeptide (TPR) repeat protein